MDMKMACTSAGEMNLVTTAGLCELSKMDFCKWSSWKVAIQSSDCSTGRRTSRREKCRIYSIRVCPVAMIGFLRPFSNWLFLVFLPPWFSLSFCMMSHAKVSGLSSHHPTWNRISLHYRYLVTTSQQPSIEMTKARRHVSDSPVGSKFWKPLRGCPFQGRTYHKTDFSKVKQRIIFLGANFISLDALLMLTWFPLRLPWVLCDDVPQVISLCG